VEVTKILLQFKTRWWERELPRLDPKDEPRDGGVITDLPIRYVMFPGWKSAQFGPTNPAGS
jgi:monoamine oxidase